MGLKTWLKCYLTVNLYTIERKVILYQSRCPQPYKGSYRGQIEIIHRREIQAGVCLLLFACPK